MIPSARQTTFIILVLLSLSRAKIMRNNALMTKMVSNFRNDNNELTEPDEKPDIVMSRMQNVLCTNFPTIPCAIITQDETLRKLIEKSIQQINSKKTFLEKTTPHPGYLTLFPAVNSEDLSNFLQVRDNNYVRKISQMKTLKTKKESKTKQKNVQEKKKQKSKKSQRTSVYNRKKIRKFYPHKVKYRDKVLGTGKEEFGDRSDDRLSMSVEVPDMTLTKKHQHYAYKMEPADPPVWRIDYMKHGEPSMNMFAFDTDRLKGMMKTGPNVVVDENLDRARKDVLHPDLYINKNFVRKNSVADLNSDNID